MKLRYIIKTLLIEINRFIRSFVATTLMLTISFALILFETTLYADYIYRMIHNQSLLSVDSAQLYIVNTEYYKMFWNEEEMKNYYSFIIGLNSKEDGINSGLYYLGYMNSNIELLCISKELIPIGKLKDIYGKDIEFKDANSVAVGYELKDKYPIGTIIIDEEHGTEYQVNQILERDSKWLGNDASGGLQPSINLDNLILLDADYHLEVSGYLNVINAANNSYLFHPTMKENDVNQYLQIHADGMGIQVYDSVSLQKKSEKMLIYAYNSQSIELLFAIISFILSMVGQYLAVIINMEYRKHFFSVLLACKWTGKDLCRMSIMECSLRLILSLCIAIPVSYFSVKNMLSGTAIEAFRWVLPVLLIILVLFNLICNKLIIHKMNNYQLKEMLVKGKWK